jgi:hypothetical protein
LTVQSGDDVRTNVIIIDDFYSNPDEVRAFALQQEFVVKKNFPGKRTASFINESTKEGLQKIIQPFGGNIIDWYEEEGGTGSFQYTTALDRSWMHVDNYNTWAGVCYLTPNAPLSGGTGLFKHKERNTMYDMRKSLDGETQDMTKWEMVDRIGNVYNRLVLYRGDIYHTSLDYFGKDIQDGRLFQVFFLNTEY